MNNPIENAVTQFAIAGMHCGGCVKKVQSTLSSFADEVEVTLTPPRALIKNSTASLSELNQALAAIGSYVLTPVATDAALSAQTDVHTHKDMIHTGIAGWLATYRPLLLIIGYILLTTLAIQTVNGNFNGHQWMGHFMAGFFLVFSFFKLLDLRGFASSYAMYDLLAKRWSAYGFIYPFIELALGLGYALAWQPVFINAATFIVMSFSSIGVILAVSNRQKIRCACLGSVFNLPMSTVTIIEDLLMAGMAAMALL